MTRILSLLLLITFLLMAGCAFNRSDFVTNANGAPNSSDMSSDGKTVGSVLRNGLRAGVNY